MTRLDDDHEETPGGLLPTATHGTKRAPFLRIVMEVALIAIGVFLGLMGEQWRERQQHRETARATLQRVRTEFQTNRANVAAVKDLHVTELAGLGAYINADAKTRATMPLPMSGTHPAFLEYTAWDLALATQSLAYVDPELATAIAHIYAIQRQLDGATRDITQVMYSKSGDADVRAVLSPIAVYVGDCTLIEPRLLAKYDEILPRLARALGESPAATPAPK